MRHGAHSASPSAMASPSVDAASVHVSARDHAGRGARAGGPSTTDEACNASSISSRASAAESRRRLRSFSRQRRSSRRMTGGVSAGSAVQSGSRVRTNAIVSDTSSPLNASAAGQHLEQHGAKRPQIAAPVDRPALRLLRAHVGRGPENHPHAASWRGW